MPSVLRHPGASRGSRSYFRQLLLAAGDGALQATLFVFLLWNLGCFEVFGVGNAPAFVAIGCVVGALASLNGRNKAVSLANAGLLAVFLLVSLTPLIRPLARAWMRSDSLPTTAVDAIVVLSSGLTADSTLGGGGMDRLLQGAELFREGRAPRLVTSRISSRFSDAVVTSDPDQRRLVALAGASGAWTVVDSVSTTRDEAVRTANALLPQGFRTLIVVTSPLHTRRACGAFETMGFSVTCIASRERGTLSGNPRSAIDRLASFRSYVYERLGTFKYERMGWLH